MHTNKTDDKVINTRQALLLACFMIALCVLGPVMFHHYLPGLRLYVREMRHHVEAECYNVTREDLGKSSIFIKPLACC